jgi:DNA-directed RNA polymerase specialized sigma24 family protein
MHIHHTSEEDAALRALFIEMSARNAYLPAAHKAVYSRFVARILPYIRYQFKDIAGADANDIFQDMTLKVINSIQNGNLVGTKTGIIGYIVTTLQNMKTDALNNSEIRRQPINNKQDIDKLPELEDNDSSIYYEDDILKIASIIAAMSERERIVIDVLLNEQNENVNKIIQQCLESNENKKMNDGAVRGAVNKTKTKFTSIGRKLGFWVLIFIIIRIFASFN